MPKVTKVKPVKTKKLGRNDPCHCGSGKKYKDCHLPIEEAARSHQLQLRQAQDTLLPKIIVAAQEQPTAFPQAFEHFWQGKYEPSQMGELDDLEDRGAERFLTWFAFDHPLDDGVTLVERLAAQVATGEIEVEPAEAELLAMWRTTRLRAYRVIERHKGKSVTLNDLLTQQQLIVADHGASKRLEPDEVVVGHLVPADTAPNAEQPTYYFAGAAAQLTPDTAERLIEFAELYLADLRRTQPEATWEDLITQRSYILNHFVSALPREESDPSVMDRIIVEGRSSLLLTGEAIGRLLGRDQVEETVPKSEKPSADDAETASTNAKTPANETDKAERS